MKLIRILFLSWFALLFSSNLLAAKEYGSLIVTEVRSIYDGDSFKVNIEGLHPIIGQSIGIRVNGVDTPEMRSKCKEEKLKARQAKKHTVAFLRQAKVIELRNIQRDKYFRIVADVYADDKSLAESLINKGLGVQYYGGKKRKWCSVTLTN